MTHEQAAEAVGRSRAAVSNLLRLLTLCTPVQEMLIHGKLDMGHARSLIGLSGAHQVILAERIVHDQLSVREAEKIVKVFNEAPDEEVKDKQATSKNNREDQDVLRLQESLSEQLGTAVIIQNGKNGKGVLKINYANLDQLDELIAKLVQ